MDVVSEAATAAGRAPYRHRLELLAAGAVEPHLDAWAVQRGLDVAGPWRRTYGKLRPKRSPWALLVYDAPGVPTVQVRLLEADDDRAVAAADAGDLGRVEVVACADDSALPGLQEVLSSLDSPRVARYHPGDRCTVRGGTDAGARFVKVFSDEADDQVEAAERWQASVSGVLSFAVAEPHGWVERTRSSWYGVVPGAPLEPLLAGPEGERLSRRVGTSLGELAVSGLLPSRVDDSARQLARTRRQLGRGADAVPALTDDFMRALEVLMSAHERLGPASLVPIHGAAHLGQWLVDDAGRLGLIDFDRFAMGEPEFDLATFVVELLATSGARASGAALRDAVLDGFRSVAGEPDPARLELYLVHKGLGRAARAAAGLAPDGEERARRQLGELAPSLAALR
ncbi:MAG TPA: aminoglycoside phosphotransferase family protein [Nocardioides sp.]|uniref:aminoglycoside phosphotransferase family protein n=1 Tax=Nocardioides sp. TaxID=35761 RepID=UPI002D7FB421|nr:aminoglycoside phosphotransferase family protein [Nocardioides sp.]HET6651390.1 aminoglycoside phosphotransferase family protein [Nocardioides sp.]